MSFDILAFYYFPKTFDVLELQSIISAFSQYISLLISTNGGASIKYPSII